MVQDGRTNESLSSYELEERLAVPDTNIAVSDVVHICAVKMIYSQND